MNHVVLTMKHGMYSGKNPQVGIRKPVFETWFDYLLAISYVTLGRVFNLPELTFPHMLCGDKILTRSVIIIK